MKCFRFSLVAILFAIPLVGCTAQTDRRSIDALTQRIETLEADLDAVSSQLDDLAESRQTDVPPPTTAPTPLPTATPSPAPTPDLLAEINGHYSFDALVALFPDGYVHLLPSETLLKGMVKQNGEDTQACLMYAGAATAAQVEALADTWGAVIEYEDALGGTPAWTMQTGDVNLSVQNLTPENWYDGLIDTDEPAAAVCTMLSASALDTDYWFDPLFFDYTAALLPDGLLTSDPSTKAVVLMPHNKEDTRLWIDASSLWEGLDGDAVHAYALHYAETLQGSDWYDLQMEDTQFSSVYARLDQNRSIGVQTQPMGGDETRSSFSLTISHFPGDR